MIMWAVYIVGLHRQVK